MYKRPPMQAASDYADQFNYRSPSFNYKGRKAHYQTFTYMANTVPLGNTPLFDNVEYGEVIGFRFYTDDRDIALNITLYGEADSKYLLNPFTIAQWLARGSGQAPGDATPLPGPISPDRAGLPNPVYPWVARYKDTEGDEDILGEDAQQYVLMYTPQNPVPFRRIAAYIANFGHPETSIDEATIDMIIFESMDGR